MSLIDIVPNAPFKENRHDLAHMLLQKGICHTVADGNEVVASRLFHSVLQLVFSLRAGKNAPPAAPSAKPTEEDGTFKVEDWDDDAANRNADTKALIAIFAILIVYMALMSVLGFLISSALFLFATMMLLTPKQKRKLPVIVILSVIVAIGVYYLFVYGLDMVLPAGILG